MPADRPRAFEYRGPGEYVEGIPFGRTYDAGDHYVATFKMHPDDVELVCPVEVTADVTVRADRRDLRSDQNIERRPW